MNPELKYVILLAEDNPDDVEMIKRACTRSGIAHSVVVVEDGEQVIEYLCGTGIYADREKYPLPRMIFLDLFLPRINGLDVLEWIRKQPHLQEHPVIMLTGSARVQDIERAYGLGVNTYLVKSVSPSEFNRGIHVMLKYWLE